MYGSDVTVTSQPTVLFLGWLVPGESGMFGDRNLSALGTCVSLLPAHLQPSGAPGPTEALLNSSRS